MSKIVIYKSGEKVREVALPASGLIVGRNPGNNVIQLEADLISRVHAEIYSEGGATYVKDKNSTNGTFLNGLRLDSGAATALNNGDRLRLGREGIYELELVGAASSAATVADLAPGKAAAPAAPPASAPLAADVKKPAYSPLMSQLVSAREAIPVWSEGVTEVRVADIIEETHDVKTYRFVGRDPLMFSYHPGQFVTLILNINGEEVKRSYSMSSTPSRPHCIELTIKRVPDGLVSNWLADNLKLGDTVKLRGPSGKFTCFRYPSRKMLFVGAGSGITPMMSMSRWIVDTTADVDVKFLVSARSPRDIIFARELELLASRHSGFTCAVTITTGCSGNECWVGYTGRLSNEMIKLICPDFKERHVFTCGPAPFMEKLEECLRELGFEMSQFHKESFGPARVAKGTVVPARDARSRSSLDIPALPPPPAAPAPAAAPAARPAAVPPPAAAPAAAAGQVEIYFKKSGKRVMTSGETALLDVAEANGIEIDYACRIGDCGECAVACSSPSDVVMEEDGGLEDEDRAANKILTCVARAKANIELDA